MGRGFLAVLVGRSPAGLLSVWLLSSSFLLLPWLPAKPRGCYEETLQGTRVPSPTPSPFNANQGEEGHHHHGHHEDSLRASSDIASRDQRQRGGDVPVDFGAVAAARPGQDGKRCIDKVEMVEETEYD